MGIMAKTINMTQFKIEGAITDFGLSAKKFISIDETTDEKSTGWVQFDDQDKSDIQMIGDYLPFSLRTDTRKIPGAALRSQIKKASEEFLADKPNLRRVPKHKREEIKELVTLKMLAKIPPSPALIDGVVHGDTLIIFTASSSAIDRFTTHLRKTFPELQLSPYAPFFRAMAIEGGKFVDDINRLDQSTGGFVLSKIRDNKWIGEQFLLWLVWKTYEVNANGAWINDKIVLHGEAKKVTLTGEDQVNIVRSALNEGRKITSAMVYLENDENNLWTANIDTEMMAFKSFKCPQVLIERKEDQSERDAAFYEKMYLIGKGEELLNKALTEFLNIRLGYVGVDSWTETYTEIVDWFAIS